MKRLHPLLCLILFTASLHADDNSVRKNIRKIRRAFLDVLELVPTSEEVDWYVVYNQNGYEMAADYLATHAPPDKATYTRELLLNPTYWGREDELLDKSVIEKNVVYLSGLSKT
ncbi:MAG: hypothetical protein ORN83_03635, partial [Chthoniobacteraceae bacterium]|nr:hypothetical protein [Chthoniobacteraceae bacterium]